MILHTIKVATIPTQAYKHLHERRRPFNGEIGGPEHLAYVFERSKGKCPFEGGDEVLYKNRIHCIINIHDDLETIEWEGFKAKYIELYCPNTNAFELVHHSDLKMRKKRK